MAPLPSHNRQPVSPPSASLCRSALAGQQAPGAASLARLFSACTSVCHFLAGLEGEELAICFAPPRSAHSPGVVAAVAAGMAVEVAKVPQAVLHLLWPALLASRPTEAGGEAARQCDRWVHKGAAGWHVDCNGDDCVMAA